MTRSFASVSASARLAAALGAIGLAALALITLASPGATRMFAWPWTIAYALALALPVLALLMRAIDSGRPLVLPAPSWTLLVALAAPAVVVPALASPFRGPSLLASAPLLAGLAFFLVLFDWLQTDGARREWLARGLGLFFATTAVASVALWVQDLPGRSATEIFNARNPYPLGHSNYTAGLALLALPWFGRLGWRAARPISYAWAAAIALALVMLGSSGSRGGMLGLAALVFAALVAAPMARRHQLALGASLACCGLALAFAHPRTRAMFLPTPPGSALDASNVQRTAMLTAGLHMGRDRPMLGWGPGATPLVYPRYRAGLDGGVEDVLQLHSAPVQLWAELGAPGLGCALALVILVARSARRELTATLSLVGYGVLALTDWQLDVPVFSFGVAAAVALLAAPAPAPARVHTSRLVGLAAFGALAVVGLLGRRDPTPEMNVRALALARDPARAEEAAALFRASLALNPDQEIAHFNLGWLIVTRDPAEAERHFYFASQLVPDKGGVYFGLGLARLNQNDRAGAAHFFAIECLNDPAFLTSPWWREPAIAATRAATRAEFSRLVAGLEKELPAHSWAAAQLARVGALAPKLGEVPPGPEKKFFRARTGYPVLMRNLDLATPVDLLLVREVATPPADGLPEKGWLPSPRLLSLLEVLDAPREK